jgi:Mor family transcriptional regulator
LNKNEQALNTLRTILGEELFKIVCDNMAGMRVYIKPYTLYQSMVERNYHIKEDFYSGVGVSALAAKYNLTESRIQDIIYDREGG